MDSLSQFVLGAAVGGAVLGHRAGAKALVWGGVVATLPDLDIFVPLGDPVSAFTYHRSASHSVLLQTLATPIIAWLILRLHPQEQANRIRWMALVWLALVTHALLDSFTIYGTQVFWPLSSYPVGWGTVFIIDPLYTVPLVVAVVGAFCLRRQPGRLRRWSVAGLALSSAYLAFGVGAKLHVDRVTAQALAQQGLPDAPFATMPTAFNTILWRAAVMVDGGYLEGFYSLFDRDQGIRFTRYADRRELLDPVRDDWAVQRLAWFSRGFYRVALNDDGQVTMTDLRLGQEPYYVFSFVVAEQRGDEIVAMPNTRYLLPQPNSAALRKLWARIATGPDYDMRF